MKILLWWIASGPVFIHCRAMSLAAALLGHDFDGGEYDWNRWKRLKPL